MNRPLPRQWVVLWVGALWVILTLAVAEEYVFRAVFGALLIVGLLYWQLAPKSSSAPLASKESDGAADLDSGVANSPDPEEMVDEYSPLTVREFFVRQECGGGYASLGPGCQIVRLRGFFLLNTEDFVERVLETDEIDPLIDMVEDMLQTSEVFTRDNVTRNDSFGSRKRAPSSSNDDLRTWTFRQVATDRLPVDVMSELMAAGVNEGGARTLVAIGLWLKLNPHSGMPSKVDLLPFERLLLPFLPDDDRLVRGEGSIVPVESPQAL